ncbi:MAG: universal stress protein [Hyphomicrobiales bacterium]|nr:universal stress protein [Hyphomicrobiales bacterium]
MSCRDLFCVFESLDGSLTPAFAQALAIARAQKAYLTSVAIARTVSPPGSAFSSGVVAGALGSANERVRHAAAEAARAADDAARLAGVNHATDVHEGTMAQSSLWIARRARAADLTVVDRPSSMLEARQAFFEDALFASGRPVLVASPGHVSERVGRIALAWDGSQVAARALGDALATFPDVRHADIIVVSGEKDLSHAVPGVEIARHLARRDIAANVIDVAAASRNAARTLDDAARAAGADVLVMGGFGHSRLREFVLGGVTRELTQTAGLPLLLSH